MAGEKRDRARTEMLERVAREVVRASAAGEAEAQAAADSPFLYARVRAHIEEERRRREAGEGWLALFRVLVEQGSEVGWARVAGAEERLRRQQAGLEKMHRTGVAGQAKQGGTRAGRRLHRHTEE